MAALTVDATRVCFFADFDIEILHSVVRRPAAAPPKPHLGPRAGGAGSQSAPAPGIERSTARIAADCQSFLQSTLQRMRTCGRHKPGFESRTPNGTRAACLSALGPDNLLRSRTQLASCRDCMPRHAARESPKRSRSSVDLIVVGAVGERA
jgi:hypothetical protein